MSHDVYLISSVFHLVIAAGVAAARPQTRPIFAFLRFDILRYQSLESCLLKFLPDDGRAVFLEDKLNKQSKRKSNSEALLALAKQYSVQQIFVGNDRHIEFQFLASKLKAIEPKLRCVYLDEGLFSYLGRKASQSFAEKWVDQALKKILYGGWYKTPKTIGASYYIDEAWLAFPGQACKELRSKPLKELPLLGFKSESYQQFITCWSNTFGLPDDLGKIDFVITITDEKNFIKFPNYRQSIQKLVLSLIAQSKKVAIKYHPNANNQDLLNIGKISSQVLILPSSAPFEVLLPLLLNATLIAEFSSTLLTARLLYPDKLVYVVEHNKQTPQPELTSLLRHLDITQRPLTDLINEATRIAV